MPQEVVAVMRLNAANKPIKTRWTTVGLVNSNQVHPREVFADPVGDRAAAIIVVRNHPSTHRTRLTVIAAADALLTVGAIFLTVATGHFWVRGRGATASQSLLGPFLVWRIRRH